MKNLSTIQKIKKDQFTTEITKNTERKRRKFLPFINTSTFSILLPYLFLLIMTADTQNLTDPGDMLTSRIIGAAIDVHRILGPGLLESAYEACLSHELKLLNLKVEHQKAVPIVYKNVTLDCGYRLDLLVENRVIVEIKSVQELAVIHEAQLLSYLKLRGGGLGLLINFNVKLLKDGIRRLRI